MLPLAADIYAQSEFLVSLAKPLIALAVFTGWAVAAGHLDKDAEFFFYKRRLWSGVHVGAACLALLLLGVVPFFAAGLLLAMLILAGDLGMYVVLRNQKVQPHERWTLDYRSYLKKYERSKQEKVQQKAVVKLLGKDETFLDLPTGSDSQAQAFKVFTETMEFAVPRNAQKVEFTVSKETAELRVWLDGVEYPQQAPEPKLALEVINFLKGKAGMDVNEVRRKQTGKIFVEIEGHGRHQLQVTSIGTTRSISLTFEINAAKRGDVPFDFLGYTPEQKEAVLNLIATRGRVVLIAVPPQQGGSAVLYSMIKKHDAYTSTLMVYERTPQVEVDGAKHVKYPENGTNEQINAQFSAMLRSEPEVMALPNGVLDPAMARTILGEAETVRFYVPISAKDTFTALQAWQTACGDTRASAHAVAGAISARLVRRLCHSCRVAYQPDADAMRKINLTLPQDGMLYKASGKVIKGGNEQSCPDCLGVGYKGRIGAYEVLVLDDTSRAFLAAGRHEELRVHMRKNKMKTLQEAALAHVAAGVTDVREVTRVLNAAA